MANLLEGKESSLNTFHQKNPRCLEPLLQETGSTRHCPLQFSIFNRRNYSRNKQQDSWMLKNCCSLLSTVVTVFF